ncbi:MAG: 50S ribosomal protein L22 [Bacillota bacterium]
MEQSARASTRHVRIAPRKARAVMDLVRGKPVDEALAILRHTPRRGTEVIEKVLNSAIANAVNNFDLDEDILYVAEGVVNEGATMKRWRPRARGLAAPILKRTSHIEIVVAEREEV